MSIDYASNTDNFINTVIKIIKIMIIGGTNSFSCPSSKAISRALDMDNFQNITNLSGGEEYHKNTTNLNTFEKLNSIKNSKLQSDENQSNVRDNNTALSTGPQPIHSIDRMNSIRDQSSLDIFFLKEISAGRKAHSIDNFLKRDSSRDSYSNRRENNLLRSRELSIDSYSNRKENKLFPSKRFTPDLEQCIDAKDTGSTKTSQSLFLIVDDSNLNRKMMSKLVVAQGHSFELAEDG